MSLIQAVIIGILFVLGMGIGNLLWHLGTLSHLVSRPTRGLDFALEMLLGAIAVERIAWPIYRRNRWLPSFPKCPTPDCSSPGYTLVSAGTDGFIWKCDHCGRLIRTHGEVVDVLDAEGAIVAQFTLKWPKVVGRWRLRPLLKSSQQ